MKLLLNLCFFLKRSASRFPNIFFVRSDQLEIIWYAPATYSKYKFSKGLLPLGQDYEAVLLLLSADWSSLRSPVPSKVRFTCKCLILHRTYIITSFWNSVTTRLLGTFSIIGTLLSRKNMQAQIRSFVLNKADCFVILFGQK